MKQIALKSIKIYKTNAFLRTLFSLFPLNLSSCKYIPTCSEYMYDAIEKYGVIKGARMGMWRILRCNPWSRGGHDPVR